MGARYSAPMLFSPGPSGASPPPSLRFCAHALFAIRTLVPPVSLAPSCHLRVRRRPRIGFLPRPSSSALFALSPPHTPRPCSPLASPVLHTLVSQQDFDRKSLPTDHPLQWRCCRRLCRCLRLRHSIHRRHLPRCGVALRWYFLRHPSPVAGLRRKRVKTIRICVT